MTIAKARLDLLQSGESTGGWFDPLRSSSGVAIGVTADGTFRRGRGPWVFGIDGVVSQKSYKSYKKRPPWVIRNTMTKVCKN